MISSSSSPNSLPSPIHHHHYHPTTGFDPEKKSKQNWVRLGRRSGCWEEIGLIGIRDPPLKARNSDRSTSWPRRSTSVSSLHAVVVASRHSTSRRTGLKTKILVWIWWVEDEDIGVDQCGSVVVRIG
ncbi:hypothetical protein Q3G72_008125 [Acer saccharum]|nr:hypothetical protein Q3G72_008125 [Acer saccharum]